MLKVTLTKFVIVPFVAIVFIGGALLLYIVLPRPVPPRSVQQPRQSSGLPFHTLTYHGTFLGHDGTLVRVKLDQNNTLAVFPTDDATEVYHLIKSKGYSVKKMTFADIPPSGSISISVTEDSVHKIQKALQIIYE